MKTPESFEKELEMKKKRVEYWERVGEIMKPYLSDNSSVSL